MTEHVVRVLAPSCHGICQLTEHNLGQYGQAFVDNGITVDLLEELNQEDLKEIGLTLGDRKRFLIAVRQGANLQSPGHAPGRVENSSEERPEHRSAGRSSAGHLTTEHSTAEHSTAEPTALAEQLDPEDLGHVVRAYQSLVGRYIAEHGGYISRYMGDGVLAYFGWPTANEDDATHAVDSALAITASISSLKTPDGDPLSCRCGIATGLVVVGELIGEGPSREHAVVGETPNLAARLQGLAAENSTVMPPVEVAGLRCEILPLLTALLGVSDAADPRDITARADYSAEQVRLLTLHALATVMQAAVADTTDGSDRLQTIASTPLLLVLED